MKLEDLCAKEVAKDERTFEVLRSDMTLSGGHITLIDPFGEKSSKASYLFNNAIKRRLEKYEVANTELLNHCKEIGDYSRYNIEFTSSCKDLRDAFCHEIVEGWDFDDEFTSERLQAALNAFRAPQFISLQEQIISRFNKLAEERAKK